MVLLNIEPDLQQILEYIMKYQGTTTNYLKKYIGESDSSEDELGYKSFLHVTRNRPRFKITIAKNPRKFHLAVNVIGRYLGIENFKVNTPNDRTLLYEAMKIYGKHGNPFDGSIDSSELELKIKFTKKPAVTHLMTSIKDEDLKETLPTVQILDFDLSPPIKEAYNEIPKFIESVDDKVPATPTIRAVRVTKKEEIIEEVKVMKTVRVPKPKQAYTQNEVRKEMKAIKANKKITEAEKQAKFSAISKRLQSEVNEYAKLVEEWEKNKTTEVEVVEQRKRVREFYEWNTSDEVSVTLRDDTNDNNTLNSKDLRAKLKTELLSVKARNKLPKCLFRSTYQRMGEFRKNFLSVAGTNIMPKFSHYDINGYIAAWATYNEAMLRSTIPYYKVKKLSHNFEVLEFLKKYDPTYSTLKFIMSKCSRLSLKETLDYIWLTKVRKITSLHKADLNKFFKTFYRKHGKNTPNRQYNCISKAYSKSITDKLGRKDGLTRDYIKQIRLIPLKPLLRDPRPQFLKRDTVRLNIL
jgi:hypothetical protein